MPSQMTDEKFGDFNDLLDFTEESLRPIVVALKQLIIEIDPDTCEVVRLGDRAATYGVGPKKMSEGYCYTIPYKSWVNLGFYQGAHLEDSAQLLEGTGKNMRHYKVRTTADVHRPEVRLLIKAALAERQEAQA